MDASGLSELVALVSPSAWTSGFLLAFGLGWLHAFDADHVTAVSVFATRGAGALQGVRAGLRWSTGHGAALLVVGTGALALGRALPESWSRIAERVVGLSMIALGLFVAFELLRRRAHIHVHVHDGLLPHAHWHGHPQPHPSGVAVRHAHSHGALFLGALHGLAGAAPVIVLLPMAKSSLVAAAIGLVFFGIGVTAAMVVVSALAGHLAARLARRGNRSAGARRGLHWLRGLGAASSVAVGCWLFLGMA